MGHAYSMGYEPLAPNMNGSSSAYWRARTTNYHHSFPLVYASRALCTLNVSFTVSLACRPRFLAPRCTALRQRYHPQPLSSFVHPLSLELAWPPSWRSCSVAQRPGQLASCGLTCGRKILDSMKIFDMQMPCHSLLLVRFQSSLPHALASPPCRLC